MRRVWPTVLVLLAAGLVVAAVLFLRGGSEEKPSRTPRAPVVAVRPVQRRLLVKTAIVVASVEAVQEVTLVSKAEGVIRALGGREGTFVARDQPLVTIDSTLLAAELAQARSSLAVADAKLADLKAGTRDEEIKRAEAEVAELRAKRDYAKADLDRVRDLLQKNVESKSAYDKASAELDQAEARVRAAEHRLDLSKAGASKTQIAVLEALVHEAAARVAVAHARLNDATIPAPFDGIITGLNVRTGDTAVPRTPLMTFARASKGGSGDASPPGCCPIVVAAVAHVPEKDLAAVRAGMKVPVVLDALGAQSIEGQVETVRPALDVKTRTGRVEIRLPNPAGRILPGMFARVALPVSRRPDALVVPAAAVVKRRDRSVVFLIAEGEARMVPVDVTLETPDATAVSGNLKPGDAVAVRGVEFLKDKMKVRIEAKKSPGLGSRPGAGGLPRTRPVGAAATGGGPSQ